MAQTKNIEVQVPLDWRNAIRAGLDAGVWSGYFTRREVGGEGEEQIHYDPGHQFTGEVGFRQDSALIDGITGVISVARRIGSEQKSIWLDRDNVLRVSGQDVNNPLEMARRLVAEVTGVTLELPQDSPQVA